MTLCATLGMMTLTACGNGTQKHSYGVFIGASPKDAAYMENYDKIVIDAQYFTADEITELKKAGHTVYSYIDLGSVENFRPYYDDYEKFTLDVYENWEEEKWVDVSQEEWQTFVVDELAVSILAKGVDGLFVDNTDVYYHYPTDEMFEGVTAILKGFKALDTYVVINGGDAYVTEYQQRNGNLDGVMDAVNQETIFSKINWDDGTFSDNESSEREYFQDYVKMVSDNGKDVYPLEYTTDEDLIEKIDKFCKDNGYEYYASKTLELLVVKE
ncbi:endo alpha-1,4 polygalactosaminidase [Ruminococcus sp.]|uniref:endo alpha-1,4 polygalactosaminidase n=1 Tax=Ruminococcus sp. TaxID=41978 RepID=UPI0025D065B7|nr:endo alpha-1,4 polygalactosaminidase [Ruminococcus sp.]MBQ8967620.1 endo alpha-1,4 polygalactosaminidase [Ruminococcus sp.]